MAAGALFGLWNSVMRFNLLKLKERYRLDVLLAETKIIVN
jgi:hypothetical protein